MPAVPFRLLSTTGAPPRDQPLSESYRTFWAFESSKPTWFFYLAGNVHHKRVILTARPTAVPEFGILRRVQPQGVRRLVRIGRLGGESWGPSPPQ